jgi:hypothetical protein
VSFRNPFQKKICLQSVGTSGDNNAPKEVVVGGFTTKGDWQGAKHLFDLFIKLGTSDSCLKTWKKGSFQGAN